MMEGIFNYYSFLLTIPNVAAIPFLSYIFVLIIINVSSCLQYFWVYMLHISTHIFRVELCDYELELCAWIDITVWR
jgi:hypothetical protein